MARGGAKPTSPIDLIRYGTCTALMVQVRRDLLIGSRCAGGTP